MYPLSWSWLSIEGRHQNILPEHYIKSRLPVNSNDFEKIENNLPSLKPKVDPMLKSSVVYHITCPGCKSSYVGQTDRHLTTRFKEHKSHHPMKTHLQECQTDITENDCKILHQTSKRVAFLETLEALYIREIKPQLNIKDKWRRKELIIKL